MKNNYFSSLIFWFHATRPKTLLVTIAPLLIVFKLISQNPLFNHSNFFIYFFSCLFLQIACNFTNEYYDFKRGIDDENKLGSIGMLQSGKLSLNQMKWAMIITFILPLWGAIYLGISYGIEIIIIAIISILAAYYYTGGKKPYGYHGWGEIMAFLFFGPVIVLIPFWLVYSLLNSFSITYFPAKAILVSLGAGSFAWVLISLNNLRDYENDKEKKKITLAVILGKKKIKVLLLLFLLIGNLLFYLVITNQPYHYLFFSVLFFIAILTKLIIQENKLNQSMGITVFNYLYISGLIYFLHP